MTIILQCTLLLFIFASSLQLNISFNVSKDNNFTIYNNGTLSPFFRYITNIEKRCDCSGIDTYYIGNTDNITMFFLNLNETDIIDISGIEVTSSNYELINLNRTITEIDKFNYVIEIEHICKKKLLSEDVWTLLTISITPEISLEYLKYCNINEEMKKKGTVLSTIVIFVLGGLYVYISTKAEILLVFNTSKPEGEMSIAYGFGIVAMGSAILMVLFYFAESIILQWVFAFVVSGQFLLSTHLTIRSFYDASFIPRIFPILNKMIWEDKQIDICHILLFLTSHILMIIYFWTKYWMLNNFLCFCLAYTILSLFHFRSFRQCIWFLIITFFYDVFWVYISPLIFKGNVMVHAATSINLPIKLEMPILLIKDHPLKTCLLLGLGDIVIPGFTIKFFKRFDFIKKTNVYYRLGLLIYCLALISSGLVVYIFNSPQPVLFYMCPSLIGGALILAYKRGEVHDILFSDKLEDSMDFNDRNPNQTTVSQTELKEINLPSIIQNVEEDLEESSDGDIPGDEDINIDEDASD